MSELGPGGTLELVTLVLRNYLSEKKLEFLEFSLLFHKYQSQLHDCFCTTNSASTDFEAPLKQPKWQALLSLSSIYGKTEPAGPKSIGPAVAIQQPCPSEIQAS